MAAIIDSLLLVAPLNPTLFSQSPCLASNFYGHYRLDQGTVGLFKVTTPACIEYATQLARDADEALAIPVSPGAGLVWFEQESVEQSLLQLESFDADSLSASLSQVVQLQAATEPSDGSQQPLQQFQDGRVPQPRRIFQSSHAILYEVPSEATMFVDSVAPRFWKSTIVPQTSSSYHVVSEAAVEPVRKVLENLRFNPDVSSIVNNISLPQIQRDIQFLTGEDGESGIISRHSFSEGALVAAKWIKGVIEASGAKCRHERFMTGFAPNVICRYEAIHETNETVIISGHYDSRGSFGSLRAPGGDDDGSGTTGILSIARTIGRKGLRFHKNVELVTFAGEEQGLYGSRAYARQLKAQNASIVMMIQADMTAYRAPQEPMQLGLPERIGTPEVTQLVANVSAWYSPELTVGYSGVSLFCFLYLPMT
ncbi:aminopeptidase [Coprinopsis sp. MPI-PUGE-AT-0042]|nr:aminopeptidase [Coprinopsis sp. MPI-PUGE-AT-0042]